MITFSRKLNAAYAESNVALMLSPQLALMPLPIQRHDEPFLPFGKAIINATRDVVCAYIFDLAAYMALGAVGMIALERTIDYAGNDTVTILDGTFANASFAVVSDENAFGVDAVTIGDEQAVEPFLTDIKNGVFRENNQLPRGSGGTIAPSREWMAYADDAGSVVHIRIAGQDILYAGRADGDQFAERTRARILELRDA